jgi:hypothetical protein
MNALGHTSASLSLEVYGKVVAGATPGLGETMARLVRGPNWAVMGSNSIGELQDVADAANGSFEEVGA